MKPIIRLLRWLNLSSRGNTLRGARQIMVGASIQAFGSWVVLTGSAHPVDIFSVAVTEKQILSASGSSSLKVHSTLDTEFPLVQSIDDAHSLGCHHVVTDVKGTRAVSVGFAGDVKAWFCQDGHWSADQNTTGLKEPSLTRSSDVLIDFL